jgi:hypothetical protein
MGFLPDTFDDFLSVMGVQTKPHKKRKENKGGYDKENYETHIPYLETFLETLTRS